MFSPCLDLYLNHKDSNNFKYIVKKTHKDIGILLGIDYNNNAIQQPGILWRSTQVAEGDGLLNR